MRPFLILFSHLTALTILLVMSIRLGANLYFLWWVRHHASRAAPSDSRVSVLVPARNESTTITPCITSLLNQSYPNYEIIVLNDDSTDDTGSQLDMLAITAPHLRVIHSRESLPKGWNGKSYACHRLATYATGEWLLFTDADTQHSPQSVAMGVAQALVLDADLVSAFPAQETKSWSERMFVSFIIDFLPLVALNFRAISRGKGTHTAGNGQYLLARASTYRQAGGHAAIGQAALDDFALARHFRLAGLKIGLIDGKNMVRCRMYRNALEVWEGFSRSMMHGLENSSTKEHSPLWALLFVWGYGALFVNPIYYLFVSNTQWLAALTLGWLALLRGITNLYLRRPLTEVLTTPLAAWYVMILGLATVRRRWQGQRVNWKGRYHIG